MRSNGRATPRYGPHTNGFVTTPSGTPMNSTALTNLMRDNPDDLLRILLDVAR